MDVSTARERPDLYERAHELGVWPEYNMHGDVLNRFWGRLHEERVDFQFVLHEGDGIVAQGHSIPVRWDGTVDGLPAGIDGAIAGGFEDAGGANTLCALAIEIGGESQGRGLSTRMIEAMAAIGRARGLGSLIAPVRPNWKERYPLTPIERYAAWTRDDGLPFDPWLRVHARLGAEILAPEPESLRITGAVADWEEWTGMAFPESGEYVFPHGLALLSVDCAGDRAEYWEPNVWMHHPLAA